MTTKKQASYLQDAVSDFPESKYAKYERNADRLGQLMQRIDDAEKAIEQPQSERPDRFDKLGWAERFNRWFFGDAGVPVRAFAAASFVVALALGLTLMLNSTSSSTYTLMSGNQQLELQGQYQYIIGFSEDTTLKAINAIFEQLNVVDVAGPDNQVLYTIAVDQPLADEQILALEANPLIEFFGQTE